MLDVVKYDRPRTLGDLLVFEMDPLFTRESVTAKAGSGADYEVSAFAVMGMISIGALSVTVAKTAAANTGTVTSPAIAAGSKIGVYKAMCIEPATNLGTFELEDPDGVILGVVTVGTAFNLGGLSGTITDGATDYSAGESFAFTVTAAAGSGQYVPVNATATDGSQNAAGINIRKVTVKDGETRPIDVLKRGPLVVRTEELVWPVGATTDQKTAWLAQLADAQILARTSG